LSDEAVNQLTGINRVVVPFVACGDLCGFDSDGSYPLNLPTIPSGPLGSEYVFRDVVQPPTEPSYKESVMIKKLDRLVVAEKYSGQQVAKSVLPYVRPVNPDASDIGYGDEQVEALASLLLNEES
ncbi:hypothetical protein OSTOST_09293, partial [Ostertagia ostertagi]